jgi:hypothetical protein
VIGKGAFLGLQEKSVLSHPVENFLQDVEMFFEGGCKNGDVIHINEANFSNQVSEDILHDSLEGCGGITQAEWHLEVFPLSKGSNKRGSFDGFIGEPKLVKA